MHYYGTAAAAFATFSQARAAVAPVPLFIGETGASSVPDPTTVTTGSVTSEADQDLYLRTVEWGAHQASLPHAAPWMYSDLTASAVPAIADPIAPTERDFGLVRADGVEKPAARTIRSIFTGHPVSTAFGNTFEVGHGGLPDDWQTTDPPGGSLAWDATVGHTAPGSARLSHTAADTDPVPAFYTRPVVQPIRDGETFRLSVWAAATNASGTNRVAISWYDTDGDFVEESDSPTLPDGSHPWTRLTVTAQTPPGAAYAEVRLQSEGNAGTVWFDDASFAPVDRQQASIPRRSGP